MQHHVNQLHTASHREYRNIIGLMSGTSLDGLDIFYGRFTGSGTNTVVEPIAFETIAYSPIIKERIREIFAKTQVDFYKVVVYNAWLGIEHGNMINQFLEKHGIHKTEVDFIASHGQTVLHAPDHIHKIDGMPNATLQIADGDHIAQTTGIITLCDFRQKHIAYGGEGAPLAVYGDYLLFSSPTEPRILLNLGGIANFTYLNGNDRALVTDVGPGNTLMDAWAQSRYNQEYDHDAAIAKCGKVIPELLAGLLADSFYTTSIPKSTGPEHFNIAYLKSHIATLNLHNAKSEDIMATLNALTQKTVIDAIKSTLGDTKEVIYASGGGAHNPLLMEGFRAAFGHENVKLISDLGIDPDAKEAVLFAILANECIAGRALNVAEKDGFFNISMGKICFPS